MALNDSVNGDFEGFRPVQRDFGIFVSSKKYFYLSFFSLSDKVILG